MSQFGDMLADFARKEWEAKARWLEPVLRAYKGTPFDVAVFESDAETRVVGDRYVLETRRFYEVVPAGTRPFVPKSMRCVVYLTSQ